jgi:RimJ/RimL family protein N-acetyltransferase
VAGGDAEGGPLAPTWEFAPLTQADLPRLWEWLNRSHVAERWGGPVSLERVRAKYLPRLGGGPVSPLIAHLGGLPMGFAQSYRATHVPDWPDERDPGVVGIDQFPAAPMQLDRGLGTVMVSAFVAMLLQDPTVACVQTDPSPDNPRAIRCCEKAVFRRVTRIEKPEGAVVLMKIIRGQQRHPWTRARTTNGRR